MADEKLQLTVQINSETGALEVVGKKLEEVGNKAEKTGTTLGGLSKEAGSLLRAFLPFATAGGIISFFTSAVAGAEAENESLKRIGFTLQSLNQNWTTNREKVVEWSNAIQGVTRFSDSEALETLDRFIRVTGSLTQAQSASTLAMNMAVASGKKLSETEQLVTDLLNGKQRALMQVNAEFQAFSGGATNTQTALNNLQTSLAGVAENEEGLTRKTLEAKNAFNELKDQIGQTFMPAANMLMGFFTGLVKAVDVAGQTIAGAFALMFHQIEGLVRAFTALMKGDFSSVGTIVKETLTKMQSDVLESGDAIAATVQRHEEKKTDIVRNAARERLAVTTTANAEELRKFEEMSLELDQKIAGLGTQTLAKRQAAFEAEVQARRVKINKELQDEAKKQQLLGKLNDFELKGTHELAKQEGIVKAQAAINVMQLAVQTLQVVNSLGEQGSASERARAKALLALQQALAIGWAWVNAQKAGPFGHALAAAETALIIANFAAQSKNIDRAANQERSDISGITLNSPAPGIDLGVGGSPSVAGPVGSATVGGGGGGGGGGGNVIQLGGIVVNIDVRELSVDNIDAVMMGITEKLRQSAVSAVQLALQMQRTADSRATLAS